MFPVEGGYMGIGTIVMFRATKEGIEILVRAGMVD